MIRTLRATVELTAAALLAAIVGVLFAQVVCRYALSLSLSWPEEVARYLLVWLVFLGAAASVGYGQQLVVDTLTELAPQKFQRPARLLAIVGGLAGIAVLVYTCAPLFGPAARTASPASGIAMGWIYLALPVSSFLSAVFLIDALVDEIRNPNREDIENSNPSSSF